MKNQGPAPVETKGIEVAVDTCNYTLSISYTLTKSRQPPKRNETKSSFCSLLLLTKCMVQTTLYCLYWGIEDSESISNGKC